MLARPTWTATLLAETKYDAEDLKVYIHLDAPCTLSRVLHCFSTDERLNAIRLCAVVR